MLHRHQEGFLKEAASSLSPEGGEGAGWVKRRAEGREMKLQEGKKKERMLHRVEGRLSVGDLAGAEGTAFEEPWGS